MRTKRITRLVAKRRASNKKKTSLRCCSIVSLPLSVIVVCTILSLTRQLRAFTTRVGSSNSSNPSARIPPPAALLRRTMASSSSSNAFKRAKLDDASNEKSSKVIGTHSGTFQADEAMGVWMLRQVPAFRNSKVVRSRDPKVLDPLDIVIDVGGVYDHARLRYDHHQRDYDERFDGGKKKKGSGGNGDGDVEPRCTKLSASGLVYRHYGKDVLKAHYPNLPDEYVDVAYNRIYDTLLEALDAIDTGVEPIASANDNGGGGSGAKLAYKDSTGLSSRVGRLNPRWNEVSDDGGDGNGEERRPSEDERFEVAVATCGQDFVSVMTSIVESDIPARKLVEEALLKRFETDASGEILCFPSGGMPWKNHLYDLEKQHNVVEPSLIKFVLYQDVAKMWRVQAVTVEGQAFENRLSLPEEWRGVRDQDLAKVTGIPGSRFCHAAGFIGGNDTYEGALQMAQAALASRK